MCIFKLKDMSTPNITGTPSDLWSFHEYERHETVDSFMRMFTRPLLDLKIFEVEDLKTPMDIYKVTQMSIDEIMDTLKGSDYGFNIRSKTEARRISQDIKNKLSRLSPFGAPSMRLIKVINAPEIQAGSPDAQVGRIPNFKKK
jgi:hypothetical protein